jgi:hypothetical protein
MSDPTNTQNPDPALRLIVTTDPSPDLNGGEPTNTRNADPALRLIVPPGSSDSHSSSAAGG